MFVAIFGGAETHFYFDITTGRLSGWEFFREPGIDSCRILLSEFQEHDGDELPLKWRVEHGDRVFAELVIDRYEFDPQENQP